MKKIKTFADACKALKLNSKALPDVSMLPKIHQKSIIAYYKLIIIIQAVNNGWQPNWSDSNEPKYYNWFYPLADKKRPSGFGFSDAFFNYVNTSTTVGSRLCFKNWKSADYVRETFENLYKDYLLIP